ncbi:MAG: mannose-1-phosphate guanylyltransferase/mannose-6-phosphate isomerase [Thalassolituus oleivorans]|uniref:mannose-1-phosphate guanylyltransferase/mannose-6-phosphate isomerase n=1 Tax=Thalassolituus oleivorans TaxID=187493 RepID=UPI001B62CEC1|nr:mannose-1-phosphate guanylyltransferase/mannose-6-phosphate isomerase [Thalassolituus oleivorans]MBQ0728933.1 mannose-1-phosphate guanylyltransferase/mannose-6-phosphate isomerase [Thalassolituus oleivorans]MBQ0780133.1 mannose-1-phosphate guanylyltransferase/mannose-6-phosphate isomerase [Thalassolituus oleivorans]
MIPVILAGGSGTRLWPLSRELFPKQFRSVSGSLTLFQEAVLRGYSLSSSRPIVIANEEHRFLVAEQLRQQGKTASIILEPVGRNTAPAIALAAFQAIKEWQAKGSEQEAPVLLILAADHVIKNTVAFQAAVSQLLPAVQAGKVGTLGIVPTEAATGYGYIRADNEQNGLYAVEQFVEKPDAVTAQRYLDEGAALSGEHGSRQWYWNSGMFMIRADRYLEELARFSPAMFAACELAMADTQQDLDFIRINKEAFEQCPDDSIDYAIMEPLCSQNRGALESAEPQVVVAPLDAGWSDVGSWSALWEIADKCENGNAVLHSGAGEAKTILKDTRNSLISTSGRLVTTLGVDDLIIVDTLDALLVAHKDKVQDIKSIVAQIKEQGGTEHYSHRQVYRPWGKYDAIDAGSVRADEHYQVKRISVKPGAKLSLQMHNHRAEHWIVLSGTANVTNGDKTYLVTENESTFIPIGQVHGLENAGEVMLEMIEVQSGSYLGEDDIVRLKDEYGRA